MIRLPVALVLACVIGFPLRGMSGPAMAREGATTGVLSSPVQGCRQLGQDVRRRCPSICGRAVHWFIGVDVSRSMAWGKLDAAKAILRQYITYVMVPGDRVTLVVFDHEVRVFPEQPDGYWTIVGNKGAVLSQFTAPLSVREGHQGSAVQDARRRALELAAAANQEGGEHVAVTLLLTDRDDSDRVAQEQGFSRSLRSALGARFVPAEGPQPTESVESQLPLTILHPGGSKTIDLVLLSSVARRASTVPRKVGMHKRRIPLTNPVTVFPTTSDTLAGLRLLLRLFIWGLLALAAGLACWLCFRGRAGRLHGEGQIAVLPLSWAPFAPAAYLRASRDAPGLCLQPVRPRLDEIVATAALEECWAWGRWRVRLEAKNPYGIALDGARDVCPGAILEPDRAYRVDARDDGGDVANATLRFTPHRRTQGAYRVAVVSCGVLILSLAGCPFFASALEPPSSPPPYTITSEELCH